MAWQRPPVGNTVERAVALETTDELHVELPAERPKAALPRLA